MGLPSSWPTKCAAPCADLRELFTRKAAIPNLDDHPRNYAMTAWQRRCRLTPAYDLVPWPVVMWTVPADV